MRRKINCLVVLSLGVVVLATVVAAQTMEQTVVETQARFAAWVDDVNEFVGDVRQGIVAVDTPGTVEVTFHFDHIFGDQDTPPEDALNQDALGFQPLAALASNNTVKLSDTDLANQLTTEDYQQLTEAIAGLGHVGEGHCVVTNSQ